RSVDRLPRPRVLVRRAHALLRLSLDLLHARRAAVRRASAHQLESLRRRARRGAARRARAHRRRRAPARARATARAALRRHRAGDPPLPRPLVGRVQPAPLPRLSQRRRSVRQALAAQRAREPAGADTPAPASRRRRALMRYVLRRLALYAVAAWAAVTLGFV